LVWPPVIRSAVAREIRMSERAHTWDFMTTTKVDVVILVAVCTTCGLIRRTTAVDDTYIDLAGECPGEPQTPATPEPYVIR
jgi:hypothetical protein